MRIYVLLNQYGDKISETWKEVYTFTFTNHIDFLYFTNFPNRLLHESIILNHKISVTSKHKVEKQMIIFIKTSYNFNSQSNFSSIILIFNQNHIIILHVRELNIITK